MSSTNTPTKLIPLLKSKRQDYLHWDEYFMANAVLSSQRSKDPLTQLDAVIVNEDNRIVATGYNGFPKLCDDDKFPWYKASHVQGLVEDFDLINDKQMFVVHAEANAILNKKCANLKNTRIYTTQFPCIEYAKLIVQSGISKILYMSDKYADKPKYQASRLMFTKAKIECTRYIPSQKKIVIDYEKILEDDLKLTQNAAPDYLAQEKSILDNLEAATSDDVGLLGGDIYELDADSSGGLESSTSFFKMLKSKRQDYLHCNDYFMDTAVLSSQRSKDPITQVGAVIVNEDNCIVATGYNGFPKFCDDDEFPWYKASDVQGLVEGFDPINDKKMYVVHAEANAILNMNCSNLKNTRLYTTLFPCKECAKLIVQSGISKIFYISDKYADKPKYRASRLMFSKAKIECTRYMPSQKKIVLDFEKILEDDLRLIQDPAAEFLLQEKSILDDVEAEMNAGSSVSKTPSVSDDAGLLGGDISELDADSNGSFDSSTSSFEMIEIIKSKRQDYEYFMANAILSSQRSKDPITQVGAVIVNEDNRIVATGYNGFPKFCDDDEFPWYKASDVKGLMEDFDPINDKKMFVVHAEANAIINMNCENLKNTHLYTTLFPCNECAKLIIQSGISKIFYISDKYADKPKYRASCLMFSKAKIECTRYMPSRKKIVINYEKILEDDLKLTQDPAAEFVTQEKSILGYLKDEVNAGSSVSKTQAASDNAGLLGDDINELDADSSGGFKSSTSILKMIKSKRKDYLHWDDYFMASAVLSSQCSKDPITQVGAVIVNEDNRIVATGYNGFPKFCDDDEFLWYKGSHVQGLVEDFDLINDKQMFVVHAEANAILNMNFSNLKNTRLYTTLFPCNECAKLIIQSGISKIFYISDKYADNPKYRASSLMFSKAKIECLRYMPSRKKIVIDFKQILEDGLNLTQELENIKL